MKLTLITLYNSYLGCYDKPVFENIKREDLKEQYTRSVLSNPDQAYAAKAADKTVCYLGTFDDVTGKFDLLPDPEKVIDLASAFPPGYLKKKEAA